MILLILTVSIITVKNTNCEVRCPCGQSNSTFIIQYDGHVENITATCDKFRYCHTCKDYVNRCLSCSIGYDGPFCSQTYERWNELKSSTASNIAKRRVKRNLNCPDMQAPPAGAVRCWYNENEKKCTAKCIDGFSFTNPELTEITVDCRRNRWTPMRVFPKCESDGSCELAITTSGSFNCTYGTKRQFCDVTCTGQYRQRYNCHPGVGWEPSLPHCVRAKGSFTRKCDCMNNGNCESTTGTCQCPTNYSGRRCENYTPPPKRCRDPGQSQNAHRSFENVPSYRQTNSFGDGSVVRYTCNSGYAMTGVSKLTCLSSGSWSSKTPTCQRIQTTTTTTTRRTTRRPPPTTTTRRPATSTTTSTSAQPAKLTCIDPGQVRNAFRLEDPMRDFPRSDSFSEGSSLRYFCHPGYSVIGSHTLTCLASGSWSSDAPRCRNTNTTKPQRQPKTCTDPGLVQDSNRVNSNGTPLDQESSPFEIGSSLVYSCKDGFALVGSSSIRCLPSGKWSNPSPQCSTIQRSPPTSTSTSSSPSISSRNRNCQDPGHIANGRRTFSTDTNRRRAEEGSSFERGTTVQYYCDASYDMIGSGIRTCRDDGSWSGLSPECHSDECGVNRIAHTRRISNGEKTSAGDWPWQVALADVNRTSGRTELFCGGALIDERTVITAAHCIDKRIERNVILYFGMYYRDARKNDETVQFRYPVKFILHPKYNVNAQYDNDVALIRFQPNMKMIEQIHTVCLPNEDSSKHNLAEGIKGYVVGWGLNKNDMKVKSLMLAVVPYVPKQKCIDTYKEQNLHFTITDNMLCAGHQAGGMDFCSGDSGGGLFFRNPDTKRFVMEGIVSFSLEGGCGLPNRYSIYTKVNSVMRWITQNL